MSEKRNNNVIKSAKNAGITALQPKGSPNGGNRRARTENEGQPLYSTKDGWMIAYTIHKMQDWPDGYTAAELVELLNAEKGVIITPRKAGGILNDIEKGYRGNRAISVVLFQKRKGKTKAWSYRFGIKQ